MDNVIKTAISDMLDELGIDPVDFVVEHPADIAHGDYATNVAMVAAKTVGKNPRELAEEIVTKLEGQIGYVESIEIAGPGFINFRLTRDFYTMELARANQLGLDWGKNDSLAEQNILIEKSAPNLYKPFHVGHLLNISIGEAFARLYRSNGANVTDVSYPSDISLGVAKAVWSLLNQGGDPKNIKDLGAAYVSGTKAYEEDDVAKAEINQINKLLNTEKTGPAWDLYEKGRATSLEYFDYITKRLGSEFADHFYESEAGVVGKEVVLDKVGSVFKESEGAIVFAGEEYGLHTRVFVTSNGLAVYEAKDIGLVKLKFEKYNPDLSLLFTDVEQKQYFEVIKKAAELTFGEWGEKSLYLQHGRLRFADGKVSSRLGNVPLAEDMLEAVKVAALKKIEASSKSMSKTEQQALAEQVAIGAIKYTFLKVSPGQNIVFDFDQALSFEGDSGPYLQYTHARINSVVEKATAAGIQPVISHTPEAPYAVEQILYRFPEVIEEALHERAPHHVLNFLTELAGSFNSFYAHEQIADPEDQFAPYKVALALAVQQTIENGLWVLGMEAPEKM